LTIELLARPWASPVPAKNPRRSQYSASWTSIVNMLRGELREIGAAQIIIEMDVSEDDIRNDGWIRSSARPRSVGVRLTFRCRYGELCYECGTWRDWEHNVYAIARTLRAQRMIAKDGAVKGDQVYRGFKALPEQSVASDVDSLKATLLGLAGLAAWTTLVDVHRSAARKCHPDVGGTEESMRRVNQIKDELERRAIS
jgi:hypothetical protein